MTDRAERLFAVTSIRLGRAAALLYAVTIACSSSASPASGSAGAAGFGGASGPDPPPLGGGGSANGGAASTLPPESTAGAGTGGQTGAAGSASGAGAAGRGFDEPSDTGQAPSGEYAPEPIGGTFQYGEGPIWLPARQSLIISDYSGDTLWEYRPSAGISVLRSPAGKPASVTIDPQGNLVVAESGGERVVRYLPDGGEEELGQLESPNDLVFRSDGTLYVTQFVGGMLHYRPPAGPLMPVTQHPQANGIAMAPDESAIYVGQKLNEQSQILRYALNADGSVQLPPTIFVAKTNELGVPNPDGLAMDWLGNLYIAGGDSLPILSPQGAEIARISGSSVNIGFGQEDYKTLYIVSKTALFGVSLPVAGMNR